ncbi:MAG: DUF2914 domain-containing protein [Desulfobacula sp.]|nr:DUF2914 domain-containing protein [Desulfobacula sp.]
MSLSQEIEENNAGDISEKSEMTQQPVNVEDAVICRNVVDRTPVEVIDVVPSDIEKVYCFTKIVGATPDSEVVHNWYYNGNLVGSVNLFVGSTNWRTYSSKTMLPDYTGDWKVEVLSKGGELLKQIMFVVQ